MRDDALNKAASIQTTFDNARMGDDAAQSRVDAEQSSRDHSQATEWVVGAGFLVGAIALWRRSSDAEDPEQEGFGSTLSLR